jgi:hypothetical protein
MIQPRLLWNLRAAGAATLLLAMSPASAGWRGTADYSRCPSKYFKEVIFHEEFASKEACEARTRTVIAEAPMICARFTCEEIGGTGAGAGTNAAEPGHQMDKHISDALAAGMSGKISAGSAASLVGFGLAGNALLSSLNKPAQAAGPSPQELWAQEEAQRKEASKRRLMGAMLDRDDGAAPKANSGAGTGRLVLLDDDGAFGSKAIRPEAGARPGQVALLSDDGAFGSKTVRLVQPERTDSAGAAGTNTEAKRQLLTMNANAVEAGDGFDDNIKRPARVDTFAVDMPEGKPVSGTSAKAASHPKMIAAVSELIALNSESVRSDAEVARLKQELAAARDVESAKALSAQLELKQKESAQKVLAISNKASEIERIRVEVDLSDEPAPAAPAAH